MISFPLRLRLVSTFAAAIMALGFFPGCSRLLPSRHGIAISYEIVIDTRRDPAVQLSGCFIPATFPAITKLPVVFATHVPPGAKFLNVTHEVVLTNGDPLALLESSIENNQVYLKFAASKIDAFTQTHVSVTARYEYR